MSDASFSTLIPPASQPAETQPLKALDKPPPQSFVFIDALRGIAALLVLYFHLHLHLIAGYPRKAVVPGSYVDWFILGKFDLGKYAVCVFFVISGFLIPATLRGPKADLRRYAVHRGLRLYPAYWAAIFIGFTLPLLYVGQIGFPVRQTLINLTMFQKFIGVEDVIGVFWTLQIEIIFYIFCAALFVVGFLEWRFSVIGLMLAFALLTAIGRAVSGKELPVALFLALSLMFWGDMIRARMNGEISFRRLLAATVTIALGLIPICVTGYSKAGIRYVITYWLAMATFLVAWQYRERFPRSGPVFRVFAFFGAISYGVYVLQNPIGLSVSEHFFLGDIVVTVLYSFSSTILVAWLMFRFLEAPCIALGKKIGARWETRSPAQTAERSA